MCRIHSPSIGSVIVRVLLVAFLPSCSLLVDAGRVQCSTDSDCRSRGGEFAAGVCRASVCQADPQWGCLSSPLQGSGNPGPFHVTMHVNDLLTRHPVAGIQVQVCRKVDVACAAPLMATTSDAAGLITLQIEAAFSGYLTLESAGISPVLYFFNPTIDHDQDIPALSLSSPPGREALLQQLGGAPERGDILLNARDCTGGPAAGVSFSLTPADGGEVVYYLVNGLPTHSAATTDATGYGGFVNLPTETVEVRGMVGGGQSEIPSLSLLVRGGWATWSVIAPAGN